MTTKIMIDILTNIILFLVTSSIITRIIGKPIKTIKTEFGAIYDCVDFYEQPAFQHPLLKNHNFRPQMRPTSRPKWMTSEWSIPNYGYNYNISHLQFENGGCPTHTVPIRRMSKQDATQANLLSKTTTSRLDPGIHRAVIQTKSNPAIYKGIGAKHTVWNPSTKPNQYSSAQCLIQNGLDSIQVGWTVNPALNHDNRSRLFVYTTTTSGLHCFNTLCPGYVIVRSDIPPDVPFKYISIKGGPIARVPLFVYRDEVNGNWWLEIGDEKGARITIGFWPSQIFSSLAQFGSYIECGGETYSPPDTPGGPPMGSGIRLLGRGAERWDAYSSNLVTVNEKYKVVMLDNIETYCDSNQYKVVDVGPYEVRKLGHLIFFGGPGR